MSATANRRNVVHIDLTLIPIQKQINCIWLSKVIQDHQELQEKTGINLIYIKPILDNKAKILQHWREEMLNSQKKLTSNEKDEHDGIDVLLMEWVRRSALNKIVVYKPDIERQAEVLKHIFKVRRYRIKPIIWSKIKSLTKNSTWKYGSMLSEFIPHNILHVFKTVGKELLKHETYLKFSKILADTTEQTKSCHNNEQSDDLILIEQRVECIDVTDDCNTTSKPTSSTPSDHTSGSNLTEETSPDFPKLLVVGLEPGVHIKEEPKENDDVETSNEIRDDFVINEIFENYDQTQGNHCKNQSILNHNKSIPSNVNVTIKAEKDDYAIINSELDGQNEFIAITNQRSNENLIKTSEKIQLNIKQEPQIKEDAINDNSGHVNVPKSEIDDENQVEEETFKANNIPSGFEIVELESETYKANNIPPSGFDKVEFESNETEIADGNVNDRIANNEINDVVVKAEKKDDDYGDNDDSETEVEFENETDEANVLPSSGFEEDEFESDETEIEIADGDLNNIIANNEIHNISVADNTITPTSATKFHNISVADIKTAPTVASEKNETQEMFNEDNGDDDDDDDSETEVVFEIEDSDEDVQIELQQIINNYRNKTNKDNDANITNSSDDETYDNEKSVTVLEIVSEDEADCMDENEQTINTNISQKRKISLTDINVKDKLDDIDIDSDKTNTNKRQRIENLLDTESLNTNLPSTSRLAKANLQKASSSPLCKTPDRIKPKKPKKSKKQQPEITLENDVDAVKYLQYIKNYLLAQNDEVAIKLLLNIQMAFIHFK